MTAPAITLRPAGAGDLAAIGALFTEYERVLGVSLRFQGFAAELAGLPGAYAPPRGALLVAYAGDAAVGCAAMRPFDAETAEMKRLFVRPAWQGQGLGRRLAAAVVAAAGAAGYARVRLDTLGHLAAAIDLYRAMGFTELAPAEAPPLPGMRYFEKAL